MKSLLLSLVLCSIGMAGDPFPVREIVKAPPVTAPVQRAPDDLDEVNATRAQRGLRPFIRDDGLMQAAASAANYRASRGVRMHTGNDFSFVPAGCNASGSGVGWSSSPGMGWFSCYTYENWAYAGAASVMGANGRYMQLFVSNRGNGVVQQQIPTQAVPANGPFAVQETAIATTQFESMSNCPGGVCPTGASEFRPLFPFLPRNRR